MLPDFRCRPHRSGSHTARRRTYSIFDIDSREYQGRWFTNINAWKVERPMAAAPQSAPGAMTPENVVPASAPAASAVPDFGPANPIDDLPF